MCYLHVAAKLSRGCSLVLFTSFFVNEFVPETCSVLVSDCFRLSFSFIDSIVTNKFMYIYMQHNNNIVTYIIVCYIILCMHVHEHACTELKNSPLRTGIEWSSNYS